MYFTLHLEPGLFRKLNIKDLGHSRKLAGLFCDTKGLGSLGLPQRLVGYCSARGCEIIWIQPELLRTFEDGGSPEYVRVGRVAFVEDTCTKMY